MSVSLGRLRLNPILSQATFEAQDEGMAAVSRADSTATRDQQLASSTA